MLSEVACLDGESYNAWYPPNHLGLTACLWVKILEDSPYGLKRRSVVSSFSQELLTEESFSKTALVYKDLAVQLEQQLTYSGPITLSASLFGLLKRTPAAYDVIQFCKEPSRSALAWILTFLNFGKKALPLSDELLNTLNAKAFRSWLEVETKLSLLELDPLVTDDLRKIIRTLVEPFFDHVPLPIHGGGKVAEKGVVTLQEKNDALFFDWGIDSIFFRFRHDLSASRVTDFFKKGGLAKKMAWLMFVAKTIGSSRSICKEPVKCQWSQQSVRYALESAIATSPLRQICRLEEQSYNSEIAKWGSLAENYVDTIDLSSASDSISLDLVRRVFPPKILKYLLSTRSTLVHLPDGDTISPLKFSPMGSAVCFPVQCILFASVCIREYCLHLYGKITRRTISELFRHLDISPEPSLRVLPGMRVYGDDIITPAEITGNVITTLNGLGFAVNTDKSFIGDCGFRESCGGYFFRGGDVTPVMPRIPEWEDRDHRMTPTLYDSLVGISNNLWSSGFRQTAMESVRMLELFPIWGTTPHKLSVYRSDNEGLLSDIPYIKEPPATRLEPDPPPVDGIPQPWYQRVEGQFLGVAMRSKGNEERNELYSYVAWMRRPYSYGSVLTDRVVTDREYTFRRVWLAV